MLYALTAHQFSGLGGSILRLKAAANVLGDKKIAKYIAVSWMSSFPNEEELLFTATASTSRSPTQGAAQNVVQNEHDPSTRPGWRSE